MKGLYLLKGIVKCIPGIEYIYKFNKTTGGSNSARYCYSVWFRHISFAFESGLSVHPERIAEFGPGDTLGVGLAALILGAKKYYALDAKVYSSKEENLRMFDELVRLLKQKSRIPDEDEFPKVWPLLKDYNFPGHIYTDGYLNRMLNENRLSQIRKAIVDLDFFGRPDPDSLIEFWINWNNKPGIERNSLDLIFSQSVLQHIDDLDFTYTKMRQWIKPTGFLSHVIDFKSMGSADTWYGHWEYSDSQWKIVRGRKKFYINRVPYSQHVRLLRENDFQIMQEEKMFSCDKVDKEKLALRYRDLSRDDLSTSSVFIQARMINKSELN